MLFRTAFASIPGRIACWARRIATDYRTPLFGHGLLFACFAQIAIQQTISLLGTTPPVVFAMTAAVAIGACFALWKRHDSDLAGTPTSNTNARNKAAGLLVVLASWAIVFPFLLDGVVWFAGITHLRLESNLKAFPFIGMAGLICLSPPAWATARLVRCLDDELRSRGRTASGTTTSSFLFGLGVGVIACGLWLAPWIGLELVTLICAGAGSLWATLRVLRSQSAVTGDSATSSINATSQQASTIAADFAVDLAISAASGGLLAAWQRMAHQLVPQTSLALAGEIGTLVVGVAAGIAVAGWFARWRSANVALARLRLVAGLAAWSFAVVALFPLLTRSALWLNAFVSQTSLLSLGRTGLTALLLAPAGFAFGLISALAVNRGHRRVVLLTMSGVLGFWLTAVANPARSPVVISMSFAASLLGIVALRWKLIATSCSSRAGRLAWATPALLLPLSLLWFDNYSPATAARTLFSTHVTVARRSGLEQTRLLHLDEGRLLAVREGTRGTYTVWKHNGHQIQIREDGVPTGVASCDPEIFAQYAAEVLPTALPLILHEAPIRVMVLGLGSGEPLRAALQFPIQDVVCVEPDRELIRLMEEIPSEAFNLQHPFFELVDGENIPLFTTMGRGATPPFMLSFWDDRLRFECIDPALAMLGTPLNERFDVIVSNPDHSFLARSAPYFTRQFYQHVARHLTSSGIFSQRFQMMDYGPEPLRNLVATLQSVFREVAVLEVAPGELTLLATNDNHGLFRPPLSERLAAPHVRSLLAGVGIDWSTLLSFGGYSHETLTKFVADGRADVNTVANSRLAFSLPHEVMRWGPKLDELHSAMDGQGNTIAMWLGDREDLAEAFQRQRDVTEQLELMGKFADQYWAYRGRVKELITKHPQSGIQQVKHELEGKKLPPDVARRLKYFEALGRAAQTKERADIDRVAEFESPYDPLVTYFLHQEVAELLARSSSREPGRELRHRWHALYFSSANDRSVRTVCDAIVLLLDHPEAEPNALQRRDDLDALLQLLATRWQMRFSTPPKSTQTALQDIDVSLKAAERACDALAALTVECGLRADGWSARRTVLVQSLVHPLREYRDKLVPIHQQKLARLRALQSSD